MYETAYLKQGFIKIGRYEGYKKSLKGENVALIVLTKNVG